MNTFDQLLEKYYPEKASYLQLLMEMVEKEMVNFEPKKVLKEAITGARARERVLRLPAVIPTEISVGQKPNSKDRDQFELWMRNLDMKGGSDASAVKQKLTAITSFFENPKENLKEATIPQTLSYLMFLNQFVWMLKEFNASVAGFLWEPFLASLFGGKSEQVPTSRGDIADIRIHTSDRPNAPISLKILNKVGDVKGSFSDLVKHFAEGGKEMRYVVAVKAQSGKEKAVSAVTFWEFNITADNFFDWVGNFAFVEVLDKVVERKFTFFSEEGTKAQFKNTGTKFQVKHAVIGGRGKALKRWLDLAKLSKKTGTFIVDPAIAQEVKLRSDGALITEGELEPGVKYEVDLAQFKAGGKGGAKVQASYQVQPGEETTDTKSIWGGAEALSDWAALAGEYENPQEFFQAVRGDIEGIDPARGWTNNEQFHIKPSHFKRLGVDMGTLRITSKAVEDFFADAAASMNEDLVTMFNKLADLTDNIGRFFLVDCGEQKCSPKDEANRNTAGQAAISDSKELEDAVLSSVTRMKQ